MENRKEHMKSPFTMPEGYLASLENSIGERISEQEKTGFSSVLKPALLLACTFGLIFGMGYGILSLTGTLEKSAASQESIAIIDEGLLDSYFIDFLDEEAFLAEEDAIDENFVINYLENEVTDADLPEIYAQLQ